MLYVVEGIFVFYYVCVFEGLWVGFGLGVVVCVVFGDGVSC